MPVTFGGLFMLATLFGTIFVEIWHVITGLYVFITLGVEG